MSVLPLVNAIYTQLDNGLDYIVTGIGKDAISGRVQVYYSDGENNQYNRSLDSWNEFLLVDELEVPRYTLKQLV